MVDKSIIGGMSDLPPDLYLRCPLIPSGYNPVWDFVQQLHPGLIASSEEAPAFVDFGIKLFPIDIFFSQTSPAFEPNLQFRELFRGNIIDSILDSLTLLIRNEFESGPMSLEEIVRRTRTVQARSVILAKCRIAYLMPPIGNRLNLIAQSCTVHSVLFPDPSDASDQQIRLSDCTVGSLEHRFSASAPTRLSLQNIRVGFLHSDATEINLDRVATNLISLSRIGTATLNFRNVRLEYSWNTIVSQIWHRRTDSAAGPLGRRWEQVRAHMAAHFRAPVADPKNGGPTNSVTGIRSLRNTLEKLRADNAILISPGDYERLYHYLDSRESWPRRILYWFVGAYYNIGRPVIVGLAAALLNFLLIPQFGAPTGKNAMLFVANPKALLEDVLLPEFSLPPEISISRTLLGGGIVLLEILFGYSVFAFGLAIRRRFGFPKES